MLPIIFGENLFDDVLDDPFDLAGLRSVRNALYGKHAKAIMKTDVRETDNGYEVDVDLPGFKKDEVKLDLKDGYLTISASKGLNRDQKDEEGRYIRQERYTGSCARSFYVGEELKPEDVKARFQDGVLELSLPKAQARPQPEKKPTQIEIL